LAIRYLRHREQEAELLHFWISIFNERILVEVAIVQEKVFVEGHQRHEEFRKYFEKLLLFAEDDRAVSKIRSIRLWRRSTYSRPPFPYFP